MTGSIHDARFLLERLLLDRRVAGLPATVEQIDCVPTEDGSEVLAYVYLVDMPEEPLFICFDRPRSFDARACSEALMRPLAGAMH